VLVMKARHVLSAVGAAILSIAAVTPVGAENPNGGGRLIFDYASAHMTTGGLWVCGDNAEAAGATVEFTFVVGQLMIPLGYNPGRPGTWSDADPFIEVFGCGEDYWSFHGESHYLGDVAEAADRTIDLFDSARLHATAQLWQGETLTDVWATWDLTWEGTGEPAPTTTSEDGTHLQSREASAAVTGTVTVTGWVGPWGDTLTFQVENGTEEGTALGHATVVWPRG
jgi:hypothetical protein